MDYKPNFSQYSYEQLLDVERHIDKDKYPERYQTIITLLNDPNHHAEEKAKSLEAMTINKFSTFWPRFWAATIDGLIFT